MAFNNMLKLSRTEEHVKNYRPQLLVMTGNPAARIPLVDFASNITKGNSLIICGHVIPRDSFEIIPYAKKLVSKMNAWLQRTEKIKAWYCPVTNTNLRLGTQTLLQTAGLGKLRPNIVLIGYKSNWNKRGPEGLIEVDNYVGVIRDAFDSGMGVGILRNGEQGLDYGHLIAQHHRLDDPKLNDIKLETVPEPTQTNQKQTSISFKGLLNDKRKKEKSERSTALLRNETNEEDAGITIKINSAENEKTVPNPRMVMMQCAIANAISIQSYSAESEINTPIARIVMMQSAIANAVSIMRKSTGDMNSPFLQFRRRQKKAVIDVWWLYDDGGLTLLVSHLLTLHKSHVEGAELRVFTTTNSQAAVEEEERSMAILLSKFRIKYAKIYVIPDINSEPHSTTVKEFEQLIEQFRASDNDPSERMITDDELVAQSHRTNRNLRCRELLKQHSIKAQLIVLTLPVPRKEIISSSLYMAWLEMLTRGMPPTLLIRGNQTSVLTFYT